MGVSEQTTLSSEEEAAAICPPNNFLPLLRCSFTLPSTCSPQVHSSRTAQREVKAVNKLFTAGEPLCLTHPICFQRWDRIPHYVTQDQPLLFLLTKVWCTPITLLCLGFLHNWWTLQKPLVKTLKVSSILNIHIWTKCCVLVNLTADARDVKHNKHKTNFGWSSSYSKAMNRSMGLVFFFYREVLI